MPRFVQNFRLATITLCSLLALSGCGGGASGTGVDSSVVLRAQYVASPNTRAAFDKSSGPTFSVTCEETGETITLQPSQKGSLTLPALDKVTLSYVDSRGGTGRDVESLLFEDCHGTRRLDEIRIDYVDDPSLGGIHGFRIQNIIDGKRVDQDAFYLCESSTSALCNKYFEQLAPSVPEHNFTCSGDDL